MRILADKNNPYVREAFREFGEVVALSTAEFTPDAVRSADALIIRSETRITRELLEGSRVRFVGTVSAGVDHVDTAYLAKRRIHFASAPGCNANGVAEYVIAALFRHAASSGTSLRPLTLGVVGVGNIGSIVARKAEHLGMRVLKNDPPLERIGAPGPFVSLEEVLSADVVTLHVPLVRGGDDPTYHLFNAGRLRSMKRGSVLINTARGAVVETAALKEVLQRGHLAAAIIDVWEDEPQFDSELLALAELGTAHIAGYSFDGKLNGVKIVQRALATFVGARPVWPGPDTLPAPKVMRVDARRTSERSLERAVWDIVRRCGTLEEDDAALRRVALLEPRKRSSEFRRLRAEYPVRREFGATVASVPPDDGDFTVALRALGFNL